MVEKTTMSNQEIMDLEDELTSGVYPMRPLAVVRGEGSRVWDADGNEYIDCIAGHGTANVGHSNPAVIEALSEQVKTLAICPGLFYNDKRALLYKKLSQLSGLQRVFLGNSGTEAVEAAFKFSRLITGRSGVVATMRGFHGRTLGALSATWEKKYRKPFEPLVPGFAHVPYNNVDKLEEAVTGETSAVILEVVQGEGGVHVGDPEFFGAAQEICKKQGALLIIDEVQTGFGRTGAMFAYQHLGLEPDIVTLAKSIAGGVPMSATLVSGKYEKLPASVHGSTFGGNPLACAASLATIDYIESNQLPQRAAELGEWFREQLRSIDSPLIREVRGLGLMVGVELKQKVSPYLRALMDEGVLALPAGMTVLRFLPPLTISKEELTKVVEATRKVLTESA